MGPLNIKSSSGISLCSKCQHAEKAFHTLKPNTTLHPERRNITLRVGTDLQPGCRYENHIIPQRKS